MRDLILDAKDWRSSDDFYNDFFRAVGAPEWHGRNFNALIDSIQTGRINKIEVPYKIIIRGFSLEDGELGKFFNDFADLVRDLQSNGCPVSFSLAD